MKIDEVAGNPNQKFNRSISSSSGMMFIEFMKVQRYMVRLKALIKYNKFIPECQTWLDLEKNTLMTPDKYGNNLHCSWLLSTTFGTSINLNFDYIDVSSKFL